MSRFLVLSSLCVLAACVSAPEGGSAPTEPQVVQVMVVGAFHMENPGQDVANADIESMLTEDRQAELAAVAEALAEFRPTAVAVERVTDPPGYIDPGFAAFAPEKLKADADERSQIAYRLAALSGVSRVYGIDEQPSGGEPDYFPFGPLMAQAERTGQADALEGDIASIQEAMAEFSAMQGDKSVGELLITLNAPGPLSSPDFMAWSLSRIEAHYFRNGRFDPDNLLLDRIDRIRHIPAFAVHGRYDIVCPVRNLDDLRRAWPELDWEIVPDAGHSSHEPGITKELVAATRRIADTGTPVRPQPRR